MPYDRKLNYLLYFVQQVKREKGSLCCNKIGNKITENKLFVKIRNFFSFCIFLEMSSANAELFDDSDQNPFDVEQYIERLAWRSGAASENSFDPQVLFDGFSAHIQGLKIGKKCFEIVKNV